jgi:hypothetical protein
MDAADLELRNRTYALFVELGRAPLPHELGDESVVAAGWRRLHDAHALVLDGTGTRIRMANPFSAVPTPHRVRARERWWYANCAWDAFGILAALRCDGRIESSCPDCAERIVIDVVGEEPQQEAAVHCLVPARRWWDDIVFT